ncbi:MAG: hypothetical protein JW727_03990 [Candidatus Aenigmarchaeota archaeon]|nr:hypothetical protein [Candidatus Aenigmarchaeota archaeon]
MEELPGRYDYGFVTQEAKVPGTGEKITTEVSLDHLAYNLVLPALGRKVAKERFRDIIRNNLYSVETSKIPGGHNGAYNSLKKTIRVDTELEGTPQEVASTLFAEGGHLFAENLYRPENFIIDEYYDRVAKHIGEDLFRNTRYGYSVDTYPNNLPNVAEDAKAIRISRNNLGKMRLFLESVYSQGKPFHDPDLFSKNKEKWKSHISTYRAEIATPEVEKDVNLLGEDSEYHLTHLEGYFLGDLLFKEFGAGAFTDPSNLFSTLGELPITITQIHPDGSTSRKTLRYPIVSVNRKIEQKMSPEARKSLKYLERNILPVLHYLGNIQTIHRDFIRDLQRTEECLSG